MRSRFAPSPTGPLHLGNLRTALVSWLHARSEHGQWLVRMEDLDRITSSAAHESDQLRSLAALGLHSDEAVVRQSERFDLYRDAIATLQRQGRVYECYCTRREIREAAHAPHDDGTLVAYPGTCRRLTDERRRQLAAMGRPPALRLRSHDERFVVHDLLAGEFDGVAHDVVLQRNDGVPAYNVAVVVDDAMQAISHVVRGHDLLSSVPSQRLLQQLLDLPEPTYAHVAMVLAGDRSRLAKRHGAVTLADLAARGVDSASVLALLGHSLDLCSLHDRVTATDLVTVFRIGAVPRTPWSLTPDQL